MNPPVAVGQPLPWVRPQKVVPCSVACVSCSRSMESTSNPSLEFTFKPLPLDSLQAPQHNKP